jgi:hypothetical protein
MIFIERLKGLPRELKIYLLASLMMGLAYSVMDSTFNNFLNERFSLSGFERSFLEFPREFPGFLCLFVSALFWFLDSRRLGAFALALGASGVLLIGFVSPSFAVMALWLFLYSMGQHVFMPIAATIGMELAEEGKTGQRLGQLNAVRNLAAIFGSFIVFLGFKSLGFTFQTTFIIVAIGLGIASLLLFSMKPTKPKPAGTFLRLHREYSLYYILTVLYGSRKQLFITFAPWVLVTVFNQPTQIIATLMMIGGIIGILFQPFLRGRAADLRLLWLRLLQVPVFRNHRFLYRLRLLPARPDAHVGRHGALDLHEKDRQGGLRHPARAHRRHHHRPRLLDLGRPAGRADLE